VGSWWSVSCSVSSSPPPAGSESIGCAERTAYPRPHPTPGMFGVVTRNEKELDWPEFDRAFFEVKSVSARTNEPVEDAVSMISCHADNAIADADPEIVPVNEAGERATRERRYFDWAYVCPTHPGYREGLLETIADAAAVSGDIRLDDVGFPR